MKKHINLGKVLTLDIFTISKGAARMMVPFSGVNRKFQKP